MKKPINEAAKLRRLAGLITESEYQEEVMKNEDMEEGKEKEEEQFAGINEVVNFDELKKHQEVIRKEQDYLLKITKELGVDNRLVGNFNQSLNALLDAIFKAQK